MNSRRPRPLACSLARLSSAAAMAAALFTASTAHAQVTWQGDTASGAPGDGVTWTDPLNWGGDTLPLAVDDLIFGNGQTLLPINLSGPQTANSLTFNAPFTLGLVATPDILTITSGNISVGSGVSSRINAIVAGSNGLTLAGGGTLTLAGANTFSGPVAVNASSTLRVNADNNLGAAANGVALDTGTLGIDGTFTSARALTLGAGGGTIDVSGANNFTLSSAVAANANALTKTGSGTLTLGTASTRTGTTAVNSGRIAVTNVSALGIGTVSVSGAGSIYEINTAAATSAHAINVSNGGTFQWTQNAILTLGAGAPLGFSGTGGTVFVGGSGSTGKVLAGPSLITSAAGSTVTKTGGGVLQLSGANTGFLGDLSIQAGTVEFQNIDSLGTAAKTITVGGTGDLATGGVANRNNIILNTGGTLSANNAAANYTGTITVAGNANVALRQFQNTATATSFTISGPISGSANLNVTAPGAATLTIGAANTQTPVDNTGFNGTIIANANATVALNGRIGATAGLTLNGGTINYRGISGVSASAGSGLQAYYYNFGFDPDVDANLANATRGEFASDLLSVNQRAFARIDSQINIPNGGSGTYPAIPVDGFQYNISDGVMWKGVLNITTAGGYQFSAINDDGATLFIDGVQVGSIGVNATGANVGAVQNLSAGAHTIVYKFGQGTGGGYTALRYNGPDSGGSTVTIPNIAFSTLAAATQVGALTATGATGNTLDIAQPTVASSLSLGSGAAMTVTSSSIDNLTIAGATTLNGGNVTITTTTAGLIFNGAIGQTASTNVTFAGNYLKQINVPSTYVGSTTVTGGELDLNATGGNAIPGNLTVNVASNATTSVINNVVLRQSDQIADSSIVTMTNGTLHLGGNSDTVTSLNMNGGRITGAGSLTLSNLSGSTFSAGSIEASLIGTGDLNKTGTGVLTLAAANTYAGLTNVNGGILLVRNSGAVGAAGAGNETNVGASGSVSLLGSLSLAEDFNLGNGTAFRSVGGNSSLTGKLTYGVGVANATLTVAGGTLTLSGSTSIDGTAAGTNLTVNGNGELIVATPIALGAGTLTKSGNGTLTFAYDTGGVLPTHDGGALGFSGPQTAAFVAPVAANKAYKFNTDPGAGATINAAAGSTVIAGFAANQAFLGRITPGSAGNLVLATDSANNLDLAGTNLSLGARGLVTYSGILTPSGGTYRLGGTFVGGDSVQNILALTQPLTGANGVTVSSGGTVDFTRVANSFSGPVLVDGGTLQISKTDSLGDTSVSNTVTLINGGTLRVATTSGNSGALYVDLGRFPVTGTSRTIAIGSGGGVLDVPALSGGNTGFAINTANGLTGAAGTTLTKTGLGALFLTNSNSYAGNIVLAANGNQLDLRGAGALPNVASITVNQSATLNLNNFNGLGRAGTSQAAQNIERINNSAPITFAGGTLFMKPPSTATATETFGALTLGAGQNNFNFDTTIANDVQNGQVALGFSSTTRNLGGTLRLGGNGPSFGAAAGNNSVRITFGDVNGSALANGQILSFANLFGQDIVVQGANGPTVATYTAQTANTTATAFTPVAGTIYRIDSGTTTAGATNITTLAAGNQSVGALKFNSGDTNQTLGFTNAADVLYIGTANSYGGAITATGSAPTAARNLVIGVTAGNGRITAGPSTATTPQELFLHFRNPTASSFNYTINSSIIDNNALAPVTVVKDDDAGVTFATANPYTGGTFINRGRIVANVANSLGTGVVNVKNAAVTLATAGTIGGTAVPTAQPAVVIADQSELFLSGAVAYNGVNDRFDLGPGSNIAASSATAGQGLNSLTYLAPGAPFTGGGQIRLAPGAVVRTTGFAQNGDIGTLNMIQGLPTDASFYFNSGSTNGDGTTLSLGAGTPWRGIAAGKVGATFTAGTIFANSDIEFYGNTADNANLAVNLGATGVGTYRIVNTAGKPINALISGLVVMNEPSQVSMPSDLTFVVANGANLQPNFPSQFGSGSNIAKLVVQAGGTLDPGNYVAVGAAANQPTGFAYPLESPVNANTTIEAGGRLLVNDVSGLGSTDKTIALKKNSVLQLGNAQAFLGSGDLLTGGTNTGLIRNGQLAFESGVIVRLEASNIYKLDQFVANAPNGNSAIFEVYNGDRSITTVTNPFTGLTEVQNITLSGLTGDAADGRQLTGTGFGGRITIADGGFIAAANGLYFGVGDDLYVPANSTLKIGNSAVIDGLQRLGGVQLNASNSNRIDGTIEIQNGAQLSFQGVNVYPDTKSLDLPLAVTNLAGNGIQPGTGTSLLLNNGTAEVMGALTGNGAVLSNNATGTLVTGYGGANFTFNGVFSSTGSQQFQVNKIGAGTMTLTGASTTTGNMLALNGSIVFSGSGSAAAGQYQAHNGGSIVLDNSTTALNNRLGGSGKNLLLPGGEFKLTGNATTNVTEALGALNNTTVGGMGTITVDPSNNGAGVSTTLTLASFANSNLAGTAATFLLRGPGLAGTPATTATDGTVTANTAANGLIVAAAPALWSTAGNSNVLPNAIAGINGGGLIAGSIGTPVVPVRVDVLGDTSLTGIGTGFVTQDTTTSGFRLLAASEYTNDIKANYISTANVKLGSATNVEGGDTAIQSLSFTEGGAINVSGNTPFSMNPSRLRINTGGIYVPTGASASITAPFLTAFPNTSSAFYFQSQGDLSINARMAGTNGFIKNGAGTLTLGANALTHQSGSMTINEGAVVLGPGANSVYTGTPGAGGFNFVGQRLNLNGGTFDITGHNQVFSDLFSNGLISNSESTSEIVGGILTSATPASVTVQGVNNPIFAGNISGAISLTKAGDGGTARALTLTQANDYTGDTWVRSGTLRLRDQGRLTGSQTINLAQSTFELDNTGLGNLSNRVRSDVTVNMIASSVLNLAGSREATAQTINTLGSTSGGNIINVGAGQSTTADLTINNLIRTTGSNIFFQSSVFSGGRTTGGGTLGNLGTEFTNPRIFIGNVGGSTPAQLMAANNGILGGWATVAGNDFATYGPNGVVALGNTLGGAAAYSPNAITAAGATDNVVVGAAATIGNTTINSLKLGAFTVTQNAGTTLAINTGGIIASGAGTITGGNLTSGGSELFLTASNALTIGSAIVNNGATSLNVVKTGGSSLTLTGDNTFTGTFYANNGTTTLNRTNAGPAIGGDLEIAGGTVTMGKVGQIPANATITYRSGGTFNWGSIAAGWTDTIRKIVINNAGGTAQATFGGGTTNAGILTMTDSTPIVVVNDNISREAVVSGNLGAIVFSPSSGSTSTIDISGTSPFGLIMNANVNGVPSGGLIKTGSGLLAMEASGSTYGSPATLTQVWDIQQGIVRAGSAAALGPINAQTKVSPGGILLGSGTPTITGSLNLAGGTLGATNSNQTWSGGVVVSADSTINTSEHYIGNIGRTITLSGIVSGNGNLNVNGPALTSTAGTLTLTNTGNTYGGSLTLNNNAILTAQAVANTGDVLGAAGSTINLNGGRLNLRDDNSITYTHNFQLSGNSFIDVNRGGTTATAKTITLSRLNVPADAALSLSGGNSYGLAIDQLDGSGTLTLVNPTHGANAAATPLTINGYAPGYSGSFAIGGAQGINVQHTWNRAVAGSSVGYGAFEIVNLPTSSSFTNFSNAGFYITSANKTINVSGTFSVDANPGNLPGALAVTNTTTINAASFVNQGTVGSTGGAATITASGGFSGNGHYITNGQGLTLAGNIVGGTAHFAGNNTVTITGTTIAPGALEVQSGTLKLAPATSGTSSGTMKVFGSPASSLSAGVTPSQPADAVSAVLDLAPGSGSFAHSGDVVNNGTVRISSGSATVSGMINGSGIQYVPGLLEGRLNGGVTSPHDGTATRTPNPGNFGIKLEPRMAQTNAVTMNPLTGWSDGDSWVYTGFIRDDDGIFSFAENIDDNVLISIDGVNRINNNAGTNTYQTVTSTAFSVGQRGTTLEATPTGAGGATPSQNYGPGQTLTVNGVTSSGWHSIEIRVSNGAGGAGPTASNGFGANFGIGYKNGIGAFDAADYIKPIDDGTGNLFATTVGGKGAVEIGASGNTSVVSLSAFGITQTSSITLNGGPSNAATLSLTGSGVSTADSLVVAGTTTPKAAVNVAGGAGLEVETLSVASGGTLTVNDLGAGDITVHGTHTLGSISSVVLEAGTLHFEGSGGDATAVVQVNSDATLDVRGSLTGSVNIASGGLLEGIGAINGPVTVVGGVISPGNSPGSLDVNGVIDFGAASQFLAEVGGAAPGDGIGFYSQLNMTDAAGSVSISATATISLSLSIGYQPVPGDRLFVFTRADGAAFVNPFANALEGSTVTLAPGIEGTITYTADWVGNQAGSALTGGNDIAVLVTIPEPGSATLLLGGLGSLLAMGRRRRAA